MTVSRLQQRRALAREAASTHGGVISRRELGSLGIDRKVVGREVRGGRWIAYGDQTVAVHDRALTREERWWSAVWEVGPDTARIDGSTALLSSGLTGYADDTVHISVLHRHRVATPPGVVVHKVGRRLAEEDPAVGLPRVRPAVAAIRGAHWARSDRQAALVLAMTVQQRLATPGQLVDVLRRNPGNGRRPFIRRIVHDLAFGAQSLGELDFAALCRRRGIPEPQRQVMRNRPRGRVYLDARWRCGLVVEIDGAGHRVGLTVTDDNLRQNAVTLNGDLVLRIDLLGLRVAPHEFLDQVEAALMMLNAHQHPRFRGDTARIPERYHLETG